MSSRPPIGRPPAGSPPPPREPLLTLRDVIGIPLADLAHAETRIAQASLDFIERVGFRHEPRRSDDDLGQLRFVSFRYTADGPDGEEVREVRVPLLSLLPIPLLQVKKAEIELVARIEGIEAPETASGNVTTLIPGAEGEVTRRDFVARVDSLSAAETPDGTPRVRVRIEVGQADLPAGAAFLLRKLEEKSDERVG